MDIAITSAKIDIIREKFIIPPPSFVYQQRQPRHKQKRYSLEKLLFKDTSKPSNDLESQLFDILNEQRKIINDSFDILNKINDSQSKDITDNELTERHNSPAFYEDKMWYLEQIGSNMIGLFVSAIVAATIGVDPENTIVLALLLGCLVKFLK